MDPKEIVHNEPQKQAVPPSQANGAPQSERLADTSPLLNWNASKTGRPPTVSALLWKSTGRSGMKALTRISTSATNGTTTSWRPSLCPTMPRPNSITGSMDS